MTDERARPMVIRDLRVERQGALVETSAEIDGFRVWFRAPEEYTPPERADWFLLSALLPAMCGGQPLVVDPRWDVSPRLVQSLSIVQDVFVLWYPELRRISIDASVSEAHPHSEGTASFFSGGVDGSYTFLKHQPQVTHLLFAQGVDIQVDNDNLFREALEANQRFADRFGKALVPLQTNLRRFAHPRGAAWGRIMTGAGLAALAHVVGFPKALIASTHTYAELFPFGSHPLVDPHYSTEGTQLVHDGSEARRTDKLRLISRCPEALDLLRVCWQDAGYNCGRCSKCLRTMIGLHLLGLTTPTLPRIESPRQLRGLRVDDESDRSFFVDNAQLAEETGDRSIARLLRRRIAQYDLRRAARGLDDAYLGSFLDSLRRRLWAPTA